MRGERTKSILSFQRAVKMNPTYASAWTLMGHEYVELKNISAAILCYQKAIGEPLVDFIKIGLVSHCGNLYLDILYRDDFLTIILNCRNEQKRLSSMVQPRPSLRNVFVYAKFLIAKSVMARCVLL